MEARNHVCRDCSSMAGCPSICLWGHLEAASHTARGVTERQLLFCQKKKCQCTFWGESWKKYFFLLSINSWFCTTLLYCTISCANVFSPGILLKSVSIISCYSTNDSLCRQPVSWETLTYILPLCGILSPSPVLDCKLTLLTLQYWNLQCLTVSIYFILSFYPTPLQSHTLDTQPSSHENLCGGCRRGVLNITFNKSECSYSQLTTI